MVSCNNSTTIAVRLTWMICQAKDIIGYLATLTNFNKASYTQIWKPWRHRLDIESMLTSFLATSFVQYI